MGPLEMLHVSKNTKKAIKNRGENKWEVSWGSLSMGFWRLVLSQRL